MRYEISPKKSPDSLPSAQELGEISDLGFYALPQGENPIDLRANVAASVTIGCSSNTVARVPIRMYHTNGGVHIYTTV